MTIYKCKMCGASLDVKTNEKVCTCSFCGTTQTVPQFNDDEKKVQLFERAEHARFNKQFDKASSLYEAIVREYPTDSESYWGLLLSNYGIEYVTDPNDGTKKPTCHRTLFESVLSSDEYLNALKFSDVVTRKIYEQQARLIDNIQKEILKIVSQEKPFDIFICYKETDDDTKERTIDSVLAENIYNQLTSQNYKVFFSKITLEDKLGSDYEPYIFAALNSAKVMLVVTTSVKNVNAVWVKNEWSRYFKMMSTNKSKHLIPCYKGISPYDLPEEFQMLQGQDLAKIGAEQDLLRGINKILRAQVPSNKAANSEEKKLANTIKRCQILINDGDFEKAGSLADEVLNSEPENAYAYEVLLLCDYKCNYDNLLVDINELKQDKNYQKIMRFGDNSIKAKYTSAYEVKYKEEAYKLFIKRISLATDYTEKIKIFDDYLKEGLTKNKKDILLALKTSLIKEMEQCSGRNPLQEIHIYYSFLMVTHDKDLISDLYKKLKEDFSKYIRQSIKGHVILEGDTEKYEGDSLIELCTTSSFSFFLFDPYISDVFNERSFSLNGKGKISLELVNDTSMSLNLSFNNSILRIISKDLKNLFYIYSNLSFLYSTRSELGTKEQNKILEICNYKFLHNFSINGIDFEDYGMITQNKRIPYLSITKIKKTSTFIENANPGALSGDELPYFSEKLFIDYLEEGSFTNYLTIELNQLVENPVPENGKKYIGTEDIYSAYKALKELISRLKNIGNATCELEFDDYSGDIQTVSDEEIALFTASSKKYNMEEI